MVVVRPRHLPPGAGARRRDEGFTAIEVLTVAAIVALLGAFAAPMMGNMLGNYRLSGDARGVSNTAALAKLRAASDFAQTRIHVELGTKNYYVEVWQKSANAWAVEGSTATLASQDAFSFGAVGAAPPNTQGTIGQATACLDNGGAAIANSACIVFNSRGLPVDGTGAPLGTGAIYVTDGTAVFGATVAATGMVRLWRTPATANAAWSLQ
jgi:prepilin-type N-terminal cleavage/methylation domain-containing protein